MTTRELQLPLDFSLFTDFLFETLTYPENESWNVQPDEAETLADAARSFRRFWPIFRIMQKLNPGMGEFLGGYVWEEDGLPAGMVNYQRMARTDRWYITNVSVLPAFRRRGVARKLVEKAIAHIRQGGGRLILLDVIAENVPAVTLYEKLGFESFGGSTQMVLDGKSNAGSLSTQSDLRIEKAGNATWKTRFDLETRITPQAIQANDPIQEGRFRQPAAVRLFLPLAFFFGGQKVEEYFLRSPAGQVIGRLHLQLRKRSGGQNILNASLDPAQAGYAGACMDFLLNTVEHASPGRASVLDIPTWQPALIAAAAGVGFEKRWEFLRMGLKIG